MGKTLFTVLVLSLAALGLGCQRAGEAEAREAVKALLKIQAAHQAGVSYMNYQTLLIEAQAKVNEASAKMPDGDLKRQMQGAMEAYVDAGKLWERKVRGHSYLYSEMEPGKTLIPKYRFATESSGLSLGDRMNLDVALEAVLAEGHLRTLSASKELGD